MAKLRGYEYKTKGAIDSLVSSMVTCHCP